MGRPVSSDENLMSTSTRAKSWRACSGVILDGALSSVWDGPAERVQPDCAGAAAGVVDGAVCWAGTAAAGARPRRRAKRSQRRMDGTFLDCTFINFPQGLKPPLFFARFRGLKAPAPSWAEGLKVVPIHQVTTA